jgi:hypothetical protein
MGLFWDLYQQSQISDHAQRATSTEDRVMRLEQEVARLSSLLSQVIGRLEQHVGVDLDQDGRVG